MKTDNRLKYEVWVKYRGRWVLIAKCSSESDARLLADDRARDTGTVEDRGVTGVKVKAGEVLFYQAG